jgi:hypothetical protein
MKIMIVSNYELKNQHNKCINIDIKKNLMYVVYSYNALETSNKHYSIKNVH